MGRRCQSLLLRPSQLSYNGVEVIGNEQVSIRTEGDDVRI